MSEDTESILRAIIKNLEVCNDMASKEVRRLEGIIEGITALCKSANEDAPKANEDTSE